MTTHGARRATWIIGVLAVGLQPVAEADSAEGAPDERDALNDVVGQLEAAPKAQKPRPRQARPKLRPPLQRAQVLELIHGLSAHPQVERARNLVRRQRDAAAGELALGATREPPDPAQAATQATTEYEQYFSMASAIANPTAAMPATKRSEVSGPLHVEISPREAPEDRCEVVTAIYRKLTAATTAPRESRAEGSPLPSTLGFKGKRAKGCASDAASLADRAKQLQQLFGSLADWPKFQSEWLQPILGPKLERPRMPSRFRYIGH